MYISVAVEIWMITFPVADNFYIYVVDSTKIF